MGDLVDQQPEVAAVDEKIVALDAEETTYRESVEAATGPYVAARAEWEAQRDRALREGRKIPAAPEPPDLGDTAAAFRAYSHRRSQLQEERRRALAAARPEIEAQAVDRQTALFAEARPIVEALGSIAEQLADVVGDVGQVRSASGVESAVRRGEVDAPVVVAAILAGASLLAVREQLSETSAVLAGDGPAPAKRRAGGPDASGGLTTNLAEPPSDFFRRVARDRGAEI